MEKIAVGINGYGTIGKRVADAVRAQDDMELVGVTKRKPSFEAFDAVRKGMRLYAASAESSEDMKKAGLSPAGTLEDLAKECDIIVDCTTKKCGYKAFYQKVGVKAIWQGGEKHDDIGASFNAYSNYDTCKGRDYVRVVSCNTTGLARTLWALKPLGLQKVHAVMIRRGADPADSKSGPINSIEAEMKVPSHHGPDVRTVLDVDIETAALKVPSTLMHMHAATATFDKEVTKEAVVEAWRKLPRIKTVLSSRGFKGTAQVMEMARDLGRPRSDLFEIAVWEDGINVKGNTLYYFQAVHQESDVIPDNIDCIRAMMNVADQWDSVRKTDKSLGIGI